MVIILILNYIVLHQEGSTFESSRVKNRSGTSKMVIREARNVGEIRLLLLFSFIAKLKLDNRNDFSKNYQVISRTMDRIKFIR